MTKTNYSNSTSQKDWYVHILEYGNQWTPKLSYICILLAIESKSNYIMGFLEILMK